MMKQSLVSSTFGRSGSVEVPDQEAKQNKFEKTSTLDFDDINRSKKSSSEAYLDKEENMDPNQVLNQNRVYLWAILLKNNELKNELIKNDQDITRVALDLPNQRVIKTDCLRTRNNIFKDSNLKDNLEILLTYYCKQHKISYKQGLNEVAAPMIFFHKINVTMANIYNYFKLFIDRFLPNLFHDDEFLSLQCCFRVFNLLIQYHDPYLSQFLSRNDIAPELFATPWFITLFASKMSLDVLYLFWDIYIIENDPYFIFFFALSLLVVNKKRLVNIDCSMVPQSLTRLTVNSEVELKKIYKRAVELKTSTPESFLLKMKELEIFKKNYKDDEISKNKMFSNTYLLEEFICLTLKPLELIKNTHVGQITCSNMECVTIKNFPRKKADFSREGALSDSELEITKAREPELEAGMNRINQKNINEELKNNSNKLQDDGEKNCIVCQTHKNKISSDLMVFAKRIKHLKELIDIGNEVKGKKNFLNFLTIDLRKDKSNGVLAKSQLININQFNNDITNNLINDLIEFKGKYHFCFIISEMNFMQENLKNRQLNQKNEKFYTQADEDSALLDEENILKKFIKDFIENGFPYISLIDGGFKDLHNIYRGLEFEIINHDSNKCSLCKKNSKKNQSVSFLDFFIKVFNKPANTKQKEEALEASRNSKAHKTSAILSENKPPDFRSSSQRAPTEDRQKKIFKEDLDDRATTASSFVNNNSIMNKENVTNVTAKIFLHQSAENESELKSLSHEYRESIVRPEVSSIYSSTMPNTNRIQSGSLKEITSPLQEHRGKKNHQELDVYKQNENNYRGWSNLYPENKQITHQIMSHSCVSDIDGHPELRGGFLQLDSKLKTPNDMLNSQPRPKPNVFDFNKRSSNEGGASTFPSSVNVSKFGANFNEISDKNSVDLLTEKLIAERKSLSPNQQGSFIQKGRDPRNSTNMNAGLSEGLSILGNYGNSSAVVVDRLKHNNGNDLNSLRIGGPLKETEIIQTSPKTLKCNKNKKKVEEEFKKLSELNNYDSPVKNSRDLRHVQKSGKEASPRSSKNKIISDYGRFPSQNLNYSPTCVNNAIMKGVSEHTFNNANQQSYDKIKFKYDKSPNRGEFANKENNNITSIPSTSSHSSIFRFESSLAMPSGTASMNVSSIDSMFSYYSMNGIINELRIPKSDWDDFFTIFYNYKFNYYVCGDVSDGGSSNDTSAYSSVGRGDVRRRILLISSEYVINLAYDTTLENILKYITDLNSNPGSDHTHGSQGNHARKNSKSRILNSDRDFKKNAQDPIFASNDLIIKKKLSSFIYSKSSEASADCFVIKAMYYMKMLLKITSKKFNSNILSFYFKIPERCLDEQSEDNYLKKLIFSNVNQFSSFYYSIHSDKKNDASQLKKKKLESKCLFDLSDEALAKECIKKTKDLYTLCIQNSSKHKK